jgi:flagellar basal body rod protein FlgB
MPGGSPCRPSDRTRRAERIKDEHGFETGILRSMEGAAMNLLSLVPNNLSEVLLKVLRFAEFRRDVLQHNLQRAEEADFRPQDMPVAEFAAALEAAVIEHLQYNRLVFRDTDNVRFGPDGSIELRAVPDERAETLLHTDRNAYLEHEKRLWRENALNQAVAQELLEWTCGSCANAVRLHHGFAPAGFNRFEQSWKPLENVD